MRERGGECVCVRLCVCVWEREREREIEKPRTDLDSVTSRRGQKSWWSSSMIAKLRCFHAEKKQKQHQTNTQHDAHLVRRHTFSTLEADNFHRTTASFLVLFAAKPPRRTWNGREEQVCQQIPLCEYVSHLTVCWPVTEFYAASDHQIHWVEMRHIWFWCRDTSLCVCVCVWMMWCRYAVNSAL